MQEDKTQLFQDRLLVADLIEKVVLGKISVSKAVSLFPKSTADINIKCAFDALMYKEADEDLRNTIKDYKEVQDEFLINLSCMLKENQELPQNIISEYQKYHNENLLAEQKSNFKAIVKKIKRMINI